MIQKAKRVLNLRDKSCIVCGSSFSPRSGSQLTCSPECKTRARGLGLGRAQRKAGVETQPHDPCQETPGEPGRATLSGGERLAGLERIRSLFEEPRAALGEEQGEAPPAQAHGSEGGETRTQETFEAPRGGAPAHLPADGGAKTVGSLEREVSPIEAYIRRVVRQEMELATRDLVKEEIHARLRALIGS